MKKGRLHIKSAGFSLVEILISISVFLIFVVTTSTILGRVSTESKNSINRERASILAEEALEAARNIRDADFANLSDGVHGLSTAGNVWSLSGSSDITNIFTRVLNISTINNNQKRVDISVAWKDEVSPLNKVTLSSYFTNWKAILNVEVGLTVNKTVINHGGNNVASDFAPYKVTSTVSPIVSTSVDLGVANLFKEGAYVVSETTNANYIQTFSGDCSGSGSVNLVANTINTCLITNEEKPSKLVVNKVVINHGGTKTVSDFTILVDSNPVVSGATNTFNSGVHTVSELINPNYTSTISGDCNSAGSVTLSPGVTKTCTITNEEKVAPTVTTKSPITNITKTSALGGGNITSNGGSTVTVSGLVWSTTINPTTANNKTTDGWALGGPWTSSMTGLTANTLYHVRAYATNSVGTSYGNDVTFTTTTGACVVTGIIPTNYDNSGSVSAVVTKPIGVIEGDIMFAYIMHNNTTDRLTIVPTGWIQIGRHKNGNSNQALYYKVATATEPTSYTFGLSSSSRLAITINAYRGCFNAAISIETSSNVEYVVNNTTYRAGSMTLSSPYTTIIIFPSVNANGAKTFMAPTTQGGGWAEDYANGNSSSQFSRNAYSKQMTVSGATGVIDSIGFSASTGKHAFAVALNPL